MFMANEGTTLFTLKEWSSRHVSPASPSPHPVPAAACLVPRFTSQLLTGHVLLFQDRSLRPEEIEGKT